MENYIPVLIRKLDILRQSLLHEPVTEECRDCGSKLFYVVTTNGLIFNPYTNTGKSSDWRSYEIGRNWTQHVCAQCGTKGDSLGHWEHSIMEFDDKLDGEDYETALEYLQTGKLPNDSLLNNVLMCAEEIKQQVAKYWTRRNITSAAKKVVEEQEKQATPKKE